MHVVVLGRQRPAEDHGSDRHVVRLPGDPESRRTPFPVPREAQAGRLEVAQELERDEHAPVVQCSDHIEPGAQENRKLIHMTPIQTSTTTDSNVLLCLKDLPSSSQIAECCEVYIIAQKVKISNYIRCCCSCQIVGAKYRYGVKFATI